MVCNCLDASLSYSLINETIKCSYPDVAPAIFMHITRYCSKTNHYI